MNPQARKVLKKFVTSKKTLSVAESCTGGLISTYLTSVPGASAYFLGGVVSYSESAKHKLLGVPKKVLKNSGAVSETVALMLAKGAKRIFKSQWAVAVTGFAGPKGGRKNEPVGLVLSAVVGPQVELVKRWQFKGNRNQIQQRAARETIALLLKQFK